MKGSPFQRNFEIGSPMKQDNTGTRSRYRDRYGNFDWEKYSKAGGVEAFNLRYKSFRQKHINPLVDKRKGLKKGSDEYNQVQNKINFLLDDPTRHGE